MMPLRTSCRLSRKIGFYIYPTIAGKKQRKILNERQLLDKYIKILAQCSLGHRSSTIHVTQQQTNTWRSRKFYHSTSFLNLNELSSAEHHQTIGWPFQISHGTFQGGPVLAHLDWCLQEQLPYNLFQNDTKTFIVQDKQNITTIGRNWTTAKSCKQKNG